MFNLTPWKRSQAERGEITRGGFGPLARFRDEMDALFNQFFGPSNALKRLERIRDFLDSLHEPLCQVLFIGVQLQAADLADYERNVAAASAQLARSTFDMAWSRGREMAMEQAIAYALHQPVQV